MVVHGRDGDLQSYLLADTIFHRAARGERQRDAARARQRRGGGPQRPHHHGMMPSRPKPEAIALHDEVARAVRGTAPPPRRRCAGSSRKRPPRWARRTRTDVRSADASARGAGVAVRRLRSAATERYCSSPAAGSRPGRSRPGRPRPVPGRSGGRRKAPVAAGRRAGQLERLRPAGPGTQQQRAGRRWYGSSVVIGRACGDRLAVRTKRDSPSRCSRTAGHRVPRPRRGPGRPGRGCPAGPREPDRPGEAHHHLVLAGLVEPRHPGARIQPVPVDPPRAPAPLGVQRLRGRPDGGQGPGGDGQQRTLAAELA